MSLNRGEYVALCTAFYYILCAMQAKFEHYMYSVADARTFPVP